jgi:AcrR family transcriptional regulator
MNDSRILNRKEKEKEARKAFVIDAARRLFGEKGIENVTMEDIALLSGYTRRTLYSYFKSFDEICLSVLLEDQAVRWGLQKAAIEKAITGLDKWQAWAEALYHFVDDNPQYVRVELYWDFHGVNPKSIGKNLFQLFEKQNEELAEGLRAIFRLGISDGSMRDDLQVDLCISQFLYSFRAILNRAMSGGYSFAEFNTDEYITHYLDFFSRGISDPGKAEQ